MLFGIVWNEFRIDAIVPAVGTGHEPETPKADRSKIADQPTDILWRICSRRSPR
jgi:hypothetical protein